MKLNISKKIIGLEIMTLNYKKSVFKLIEQGVTLFTGIS